MPTTAEQIDLWRKSPSEHQRLEFKEAKTQFDNRNLYEYCIALANEGGGRLLLGIADKQPRSVVGTQAFRNPVAMAESFSRQSVSGWISKRSRILTDGCLCFTFHRVPVGPPTISKACI